jgi:hypothetical protein
MVEEMAEGVDEANTTEANIDAHLNDIPMEAPIQQKRIQRRRKASKYREPVMSHYIVDGLILCS